jgi:hypothetical protein
MKRSIDQISNEPSPSFTFTTLPIELIAKHIIPRLIPYNEDAKVKTLDSFFSLLSVSRNIYEVSFMIIRSARMLLKEKAENLRSQVMVGFSSLDIHKYYVKYSHCKADSKSKKTLFTHALTTDLMFNNAEWQSFGKTISNLSTNNWRDLMVFDFDIIKTCIPRACSAEFTIIINLQLKYERGPTSGPDNMIDHSCLAKIFNIKYKIFQKAKDKVDEKGDLMENFLTALTSEYKHEEKMRRFDISAFKRINVNGYQVDKPFKNYRSLMDIIYQLDCTLINKVN